MLRKIYAIQESDLRMDGSLAMSVQRVLPVTQADINNAAANGEYWSYEKVIEVTPPFDNTKESVMRVIKVNSITPGQNVLRVLIENNMDAVVGPDYSPLSLPNAAADSLEYVKAYGLVEQFVEPSPDSPTGLICNNGGIGIDSHGNIIVSGNHETIKDSKNNTVTCDMLLGMDSIRDEQEILTGSIIKKIGIKVLDGTEDWYQHQSGAFYINLSHFRSFNNVPVLCTHFKSTSSSIANMTFGEVLITKINDYIYFKINIASIDSWKAWLVEQYQNGTPVIFVYPLATPTTESVSPQTLQVKAGDNTITITDASLSDLLIQAKYKKIL